MIRKILFGVAALTMVGTSGAALAQASATQSTTGTTRILQAITLTKTSDLAFGSIVKAATAGTNTITIDQTTGARAITGAGGGALATSTSGRAAFTVAGEGGQTFSITAPNFSMTRTGGSETLAVTTAAAATGTIGGTIGTAGNVTIGVGGAITVANTTVSGNYTGTFNVTVAYN
ncbi:DUF4402 domain-containing protein [Sphingoaurantiacus capsulatus]|uniref:DUF4402 domain-containing protein n=1 Tax=Sphingoaurantiacus capsulatus TaxID=1771310 RepID=A0ABV7XD46_9SPHN